MVIYITLVIDKIDEAGPLLAAASHRLRNHERFIVLVREDGTRAGEVLVRDVAARRRVSNPADPSLVLDEENLRIRSYPQREAADA